MTPRGVSAQLVGRVHDLRLANCSAKAELPIVYGRRTVEPIVLRPSRSLCARSASERL